jgi:hypothetical protein
VPSSDRPLVKTWTSFPVCKCASVLANFWPIFGQLLIPSGQLGEVAPGNGPKMTLDSTCPKPLPSLGRGKWMDPKNPSFHPKHGEWVQVLPFKTPVLRHTSQLSRNLRPATINLRIINFLLVKIATFVQD